jgi:hypothetical protein
VKQRPVRKWKLIPAYNINRPGEICPDLPVLSCPWHERLMPYIFMFMALCFLTLLATCVML